MFLPPFVGPALKLARARHHYGEMCATIAAYQDRAEPIFVRSESPPHPWRIAISENVPPVVALQLGDIAHSLRSSLDVMLCDIAQVRNVGLSNLYYPFAADQAAFADMLTQPKSKQPFKKLGDDIIEIISDSQPYKGGNLYLRGLHDLNNQDKHRMAVPYVSFVSCTGNFKSVLADMGLSLLVFGGVLVGITVGEDILIDERYVRHPSEEYSINDEPMVVCFPPNFVLSGNVVTVMNRLIETVEELHERLRAAASL